MKKHQGYKAILLFAIVLATSLMTACSSAKHIPEGGHLLHKVHIECDNEDIDIPSLEGYIRQNPNARWFSLVKVPLGIYAISGHDSNWMNRTLQRIGEAPVVYDWQQTNRTCQELRTALQNMGYLSAKVSCHEKYHSKYKVSLTYHLHTGEQYRVDSIRMDIQDTAIARHLERIATRTLLRKQMKLNINQLDEERTRIAEYLRNVGYYKFSKDYITYTADTIFGTHRATLTMHLRPYRETSESADTLHPIYTIGNVNFVTEFDIANINQYRLVNFKHLNYKGVDIHYRDRLNLRPSVFFENSFLRRGDLYRTFNVDQTYSLFGRLGALKYTNIHFTERADSNLLDVFVLTAPANVQSFTAEMDGTNTAGDLGAAVSFTYQHRNIFRGSETFTFKVRGAYEAISGLQGYDTDNYIDYGAEMTLNFPRFMFPFLTSEFKRRIRASSEIGIKYNTQERPEFSRRVASASWSYRWTQRQRIQHRVDLLDLNYVYMPTISATFRNEYLNNVAANSILKYNYEDLFILRFGYSYSYNSLGSRGQTTSNNRSNFSIRLNGESAGLLLNLISQTIYTRKVGDGQYALGNIAYAQYLKGDIDFTQNLVIDYRNTLSFHAAFGIAYPYANSTVLPFEKRYFSGGANSVRGWSVRSLGPGSFSGGDSRIDFINQTGDVKLDLSLEYRTLMFWNLNGAVFIDAGNIWTLRSYKEQPGGQFRFDTFLKQIAVAYGIGLRLDLNFFILRFDGGMKAINPAYPTSSKEHYPLLNPDFGRDFTFHFAVGYPF